MPRHASIIIITLIIIYSNNNTDNDNDNDNDNDSNHSNFYPGSPLASRFSVRPCKSIKSMRVLCNKINNDSADSDC